MRVGGGVRRRNEKQKRSEKGDEGGGGGRPSSFTLRAFLPHSSCARRREKVNSDVEKEIRTSESSRVDFSLGRTFRGLNRWMGGCLRTCVRASSSLRGTAGKKKFCTKAICRGLIDGGGDHERKVIVFSIKKKNTQSASKCLNEGVWSLCRVHKKHSAFPLRLSLSIFNCYCYSRCWCFTTRFSARERVI